MKSFYNILHIKMFSNSGFGKAMNSVGALSTWSGLIVAAMLLLLLPISQVSQVAAAPDVSGDIMQNISIECQLENNITDQELDELPEDPLPEDVEQKFKCYAHCLLETMHLLDSSGKLDDERLRKLGEMSDDDMEYVMECKAANDMVEDPCEYSFALMACSHMLMYSSEEE